MSDAPRSSLLNTLGWGAYLACSWTWCIGMFLPVLLIRDFGWWSFAVFAIPNCLGAAAMGWVMKKPGTSEAVVAAHGKAIRAFSIVTGMFQIFFMSFLGLLGPGTDGITGDNLIPIVGLLAGLGFAVLSSKQAVLGHLGAALSLLFSLCMIVWFVTSADGPPTFPASDHDFGGLALLAPVCIFGFGLSPYLDGTFHRAAQGGSAPGRFGWGFLLFFPVMIGFTAVYATAMLFRHAPGTTSLVMPFPDSTPVLLHMGAQLGYTIGLHATVMRPTNGPQFSLKAKAEAKWIFVYVLMIPMIAFAFRYANTTPTRTELTYRLFMSFYGLIFPAYVWICMLPTLRAPVKPSERRFIAFGIAVICAAPFYWLGFIELKYWALAPGALIPLVAGLLVRKEPRGTTGTANA